MASSNALIRDAYCARIQSILNRLATARVMREPSGATVAANGRIQVLNCCSGISWARRSMQADQSEAVPAAGRVSGEVPSIILKRGSVGVVDKCLGASGAL